MHDRDVRIVHLSDDAEDASMRRVDHVVSYSLPEPDDFDARFPQYGPRARSGGSDLFSLVMSPQVAAAGRALSELLGLPAVTAVAALASRHRGERISDTDKQFVGALVCSLMEANGLEKTGTKRSIPVDGWTRGEVYRPVR